MQFTLATIIASAAVLVGAAPQPRQSCPEATQFGVLTVSPTTVAAGEVSKTFGLLGRPAEYNKTPDLDGECRLQLRHQLLWSHP